MPDPKPDIVADPLLSYGRDDPGSMDSTKGHQHGRADAESGGADSSPLDTEPTGDARQAVPDAAKMGTPDKNIRRS